jgi:hypothetical protein
MDYMELLRRCPMFKAIKHRQLAFLASFVCALVLGLGGVRLASTQADASQKEARVPPQEGKVTVAEHMSRIHEFLRKQEATAKKEGWNYTSISEDELAVKLSRVHSPMIVFQGWSGFTSPGGSISYSVGIYNPDPQARGSLYAHVFVGAANMAPDVSAALSAVDPRFPRLTMPAFFGLTVAPGATATLQFTVAVPSNVEKTNYLGNTFLFQATYHDLGVYLDRSVFPFGVQ